jgi:cellulose synthase/poly-beta-1,6-N-acetylglucosamine synthase-like glycosyltransferase
MMQVVFIISLLLFTVYALLIIFYTVSWKQMPRFVPASSHLTDEDSVKISIVIPARNESANIKACLDSICRQTYPAHLFEVLVIDDHSTDNTASIVKNYPATNIRLISLQDVLQNGIINSYKKKAIEIAISTATGQLMVTTDADCIVPEKWLQTIAEFYRQTNAALMVMPVAFIPVTQTGGLGAKLLSIFQSLDFMVLQGITGASVNKKAHSMCNGANLAYTKKVFEEVDGFKGIDHIASGDDMLLMHKIFGLYPEKVLFIKSPEVIVQTQPAPTLKAFINQRIRWASKADKYDDKRIFVVLLLVYFFNVWLIGLIITSFFHTSFFYFTLGLIVAKTLVELLFLFPVAAFFSSSKLLLYFPFAQPFHILYTVVAGWLGKFGSYSWKGREVK